MTELNNRVNKNLVKNTLYLYCRLIVSLAISLYTSRAILEALGVEDYGIYNIVGGFVLMLSLFTGALTSATQRFVTYELGIGNKEKLAKTFSTFTTLLLIFAIAIIIIGFLSGDYLVTNCLNIPQYRLEAAIGVFYCSVVAFAVNLTTVPYIACVTAHERMDFYAIVSVGESIGKLFIVYLLSISSHDRLITYAILMIAVGLCVRLVYNLYCSKHFEETKFRLLIDKGRFKEIYYFSLWIVFGGSAMIAKEQGVNMLINIFCGVAMNAARGISMQVYGVITQFANSIATAVNPQITKNYAENNLGKSINLTFVLTKAQGVMLLLIALPLYVEANFVLKLWLKEVPYYAEIFTQWTIIIAITSTLRQTHGALYLATGKVRFLGIVGGFVILLNLPFSFFILKFGYEPVYTMVVNVAMELICMFVCFGYMQRILNFPTLKFYKQTILPLALIAVITAGVCFMIKNQMCEGLLRLLTVCFVATGFTATLSYMFIFSKTEKSTLKEMIQSKLHKK